MILSQRLRMTVIKNSVMNSSMEYCGGVKNLKVGVVDSVELFGLPRGKIPEISNIRDIEYSLNGMLLRKASGIDAGHLIAYQNLGIEII
ncbi:unnamed protein product [Didymodactylos carnosus]|uniref:Uncharacterized protein n=1 Tax=Didymodactylos carnosus TaxID=1234261 RepID=A0A814CQX7_9BILA|nr:unnamed protein product [Didymodactylos carnosus]CAF3722886.1 unnamed protein product [Didymodactylos carnosus]